MKIAVIGLSKFDNFGDQFVCKTVKYLVEQHEKTETELLNFAIDPHNGAGGTTFLFRAGHKIARVLRLRQLSNWLCILKYKSYFSKTLFPKIKDADGIIFAVGSFKYGTQDLWAQYSAVVDYADKHSVPIMFNAANVQKYNATDFRCRYLKEHLNKSCVKYFTTRDMQPGVNRLISDYLDGGKFKILQAADPGFWIPETYGVKRNKTPHVIGINIIAPNRFQIYGGNLTPEAVKDAYCGMLDKLTKAELTWELFTNGMAVDNEFALKLAECAHIPMNRVRIPKTDHELAELESNYKAVFGARLHSMICAYSLGIPVAGFIWDEKITRFVQMAKLEELFLYESDVTGGAMFDVLQKALAKPDDEANRNYWKQTTKDTIFSFLNSI